MLADINKARMRIVFTFCSIMIEKAVHFRMNPKSGGIPLRLRMFMIRIKLFFCSGFMSFHLLVFFSWKVKGKMIAE